MSLSRAATRGLLQWTKKTEQSLLRSSGPSQPNRTYSTTIATSSPARQRTCSRILRATKYSPLALVHHGHASVAQRTFSASPAVSHNHLEAPKPGEELHITFIDKDGDEHTFEVANGDNLLDIALEHDIEMEGACGGSCACSTCHVIVDSDELYDKMEEPDDDENDMLDLAFGLTETSRLGCQVKMSPDLDGLRVKLPSMTRNLQVSDFSKKNERSD